MNYHGPSGGSPDAFTGLVANRWHVSSIGKGAIVGDGAPSANGAVPPTGMEYFGSLHSLRADTGLMTYGIAGKRAWSFEEKALATACHCLVLLASQGLCSLQPAILAKDGVGTLAK